MANDDFTAAKVAALPEELQKRLLGAMDEEDQKYMALAGLRSWCAAVLRQVERMENSMLAHGDFNGVFQSERHLFLIATWKVFEHVDWILHLDLLTQDLFLEIERFRDHARMMRHKNEHVIEYFKGAGRFPKDWVHATDDGITDASSTHDTRIGNRLDWREVAQAVDRLLTRLPLAYWPARFGQPGGFHRG